MIFGILNTVTQNKSTNTIYDFRGGATIKKNESLEINFFFQLLIKNF